MTAGVKSHKAELVDALDFSCAPGNGNGTKKYEDPRTGTERQSHLGEMDEMGCSLNLITLKFK